MKPSLASFLLAALASAASSTSAHAQVLSEFCGTLVSTPTCSPIFEFDGGGYLLLVNYGGYQVGDRVHVVGEIHSCSTTCLTGTCLFGNTIEPCAPCNCTPYCFGLGFVACPCGNNGSAGRGCGNSVDAGGAELGATGGASLSNDVMVLAAGYMPNGPVLYFQGMFVTEAVFGDGKRCVLGPLVRLTTTHNVNGFSRIPAVGGTRISTLGQVTAPGIRRYQAWYRNAATYCTSSTFNLTNGLAITWGA